MASRPSLTLPTTPSAAPADDTQDRRLTFAAAVAAVLLFIPLLLPLLTGRIFTLDDLGSFHLPMRHIYQTALRGGHSLLWSSQLFSGFYVHGEGQVGAFHPLHLLLYATLPLAAAFSLELVLSYVFGFAGMWRFLRTQGLTAPSSALGAVAFAFSGFTVLHLSHMNAIAVVAHIPWLLVSIEAALSDATSRRRRGVVALATLIASQALLGYPQYMWMTAVICAIYTVVCGRLHLRRLLVAATGAAAGLMAAGVQLLPSLDLLADSVRESVGTAFSVSYSLHPLNLLQLVSPYLLLNRIYAAPHERLIHEFGVYNGALATIALTWAIARGRRLPFGRLAVFAGVLFSLGLLLALGRYGVLYEWLTALPLVGKFRAPARHIVLAHFALGILVALLFEDIKRIAPVKSKPALGIHWLWTPLLLSGATATVALWWPQAWTGFPEQALYPGGMLIGAAILTLVTVLVRDAVTGSRVALAVLPFVFALDLGLWGYPYVFAGGTATVRELADRANPPEAPPGATVHQPERNRALNLLLLHDLRVLRPYVGLAPPRRIALTTEDELRVSGVQWRWNGSAWTPVPEPMSRARMVAEWKAVDTPGSLAGIDIKRSALVERPLPVAAIREGTATLQDDEPGRLVVAVDATGPGLLVTTEAFHGGWRARADTGGAFETVRVYGDYLGVVVQPGRYTVAIAFEPDSMRRGLYASMTGVAAIAVLAFIAWKG